MLKLWWFVAASARRHHADWIGAMGSVSANTDSPPMTSEIA